MDLANLAVATMVFATVVSVVVSRVLTPIFLGCRIETIQNIASGIAVVFSCFRFYFGGVDVASRQHPRDLLT